MEYYIYHIPGVKIGMTNELEKRMSAQGFTEWEILETHTDGWLGGDRELELQAEYGYPVDTCHYMVTVNSMNIPKKKGLRVNNGGHRAVFTQEQAEEIRAKYTGKRGEQTLLAREYGVSRSIIFNIINNRSYLEP